MNAPAGDIEHEVDVLFDEAGVVVVNKPAGLATLPGTGVRDEETLWGAMREGFDVEPGFAGPSFLGRLDRPTSGIVVAALTRATLQAIEPPWSRGVIHKDYLVVVHGAVKERGRIDVPLAARRPRHKGTGRVEEALTTWARVASTTSKRAAVSVVVARIHTGRTHQIRRHMKAIGHPLVGDDRYGHEARDRELAAAGVDVSGLLLHAWRISHDGSAPILPPVVEAAPPARFLDVARTLGLSWTTIPRADET